MCETTKQIYVGSADRQDGDSLYMRLGNHDSNNNSNSNLQDAFTKENKSNFVVHILALGDKIHPDISETKTDMLDVEQWYLDEWRPWEENEDGIRAGYNIAKNARHGMKGLRHTAESKAKTSATMTGVSRGPRGSL